MRKHSKYAPRKQGILSGGVQDTGSIVEILHVAAAFVFPCYFN